MTTFKILFRILTFAVLLNILLALYFFSPIIFNFGFPDYGLSEQEVRAGGNSRDGKVHNYSSDEQRTIGFIRIHKTGSTTFLGILYR